MRLRFFRKLAMSVATRAEHFNYFSGRRSLLLKVQDGSLVESMEPDAISSPLIVLEGGACAEDTDALALSLRPCLILEDRSSPERPRWHAPPPVEVLSLGLHFVPEYSDTEREVTATAERASSLLAASITGWLDSAESPLSKEIYEEPLAAFFSKHLIDRLSVLIAARQLATYRLDTPLVIGWTDGRVASWLIDSLHGIELKRPVYLLDCRPRAASRVPFPQVVADRMALLRTREVIYDRSLSPPEAPNLAACFGAGDCLDLGIALGGKHVVVVSAPDPSGNLLFTAKNLLPSLAARGPVVVLSIDRREKALDDLGAEVKSAGAQAHRSIEMVDVSAMLGSDGKMRRASTAWRPAAVEYALRQASTIQIENIGLSLGFIAPDLVSRLADKTLPRFLEFGVRLMGAMREGRPASVSLLRSRPPLVRILARTALRSGVRTVDINPTSLSPWVGHRQPLGDYIAVPDQRGVALFTEHFGIEKARIVPVGSVRLASIIEFLRDKNRASLRQELSLPPTTPVVLFCPSYGRPTLYRELLRALSAVLQRRPDTILLVKPHPKESASDVSGYADVIAAADLKGCTILSSTANTHQAAVAADVVVTAFSTVGFEASILGTPVIAYIGAFDSDTPTEHVMSNIPITLDRIDLIDPILEDVLDHGPNYRSWQLRRNEYLAENPEMSDGMVIERLTALIAEVTI